MADADVGKIFVGGISRETTEDVLKDYFSKYGDVLMTLVAKDRVTYTPRGFGFVTFVDPSSVDIVLRDHHVISGRTVEVKKATPRNSQLEQLQHHFYEGVAYSSSINGSYISNNAGQSSSTKKIFVGGLPPNLTEEDFKSYFDKFGKITDAVIMHDNNTNRPRGFGFITFDSEQVVETIIEKTHHELGGKLVEVKKAVPREATKYLNNGNGYSGRGPRYENYNSQAPMGVNPGFYYSGGYSFGDYGFYGYGMPMFIPWGFRPFAYGTGYYPSTLNGGVAMMGMVNPYNSYKERVGNGKPSEDFNGKNNNVSIKDDATSVDVRRSDVDVDDSTESS